MNSLESAFILSSSQQGTSSVGTEAGFWWYQSPAAVAALALTAFSFGLLNLCLPEVALEISVTLRESFHFGYPGLGEILQIGAARIGLSWCSVSDIQQHLY